MSKKASAEDAEKELGIPKSKFEVGQVTVSDNGNSKSTITNIDNETGAISWKITQLPGFDKLFDDMDELVATAKRVYVKTKDDDKFREIYEDVRKVRNKLRTHLRNEYPDEYKRIVRISENDVDEISMSGAAGAYLTPYAFRKKKKKKKKKIEESKGAKNYFDDLKFNYQKAFRYLETDEKEEYKQLAKDYFSKLQEIEENYRGVEFEDYIDELEKTMYVERRDRGRFIIHPLDKPDVRRPSNNYIVIDGNNVTAVQGYNSGPISVLADRYGLDDEDDRMTPMGKTNAEGRISLLSSNILKDAIKAIEASRDVEAKRQQDYYRERGPVSGVGNMDEGALGDGADLGPGPKAGPDGVTDNAYTKQFKYKLVPKNKQGTYVQKGSSMPVRKLWGE
jgi:hypothetical protein